MCVNGSTSASITFPLLYQLSLTASVTLSSSPQKGSDKCIDNGTTEANVCGGAQVLVHLSEFISAFSVVTLCRDNDKRGLNIVRATEESTTVERGQTHWEEGRTSNTMMLQIERDTHRTVDNVRRHPSEQVAVSVRLGPWHRWVNGERALQGTQCVMVLQVVLQRNG